jgi:hypothetical protein
VSARASEQATQTWLVTVDDGRDVERLERLYVLRDQSCALTSGQGGDGVDRRVRDAEHGERRAPLSVEYVRPLGPYVAEDTGSQPRSGALRVPQLVVLQRAGGKCLGREVRRLTPIAQRQQYGKAVQPLGVDGPEGRTLLVERREVRGARGASGDGVRHARRRCRVGCGTVRICSGNVRHSVQFRAADIRERVGTRAYAPDLTKW